MSQATSTIHVMLVEDDERLGRLTARYLESHGVVVTWVQDGRVAVEEARKLSLDAVVLDLMLPGKDGITVCKELREFSDVPVLMLTARTEEADRVQGLDVGADDYVLKPFSSRELLARIQAHIRRSRGQTGPAIPRAQSVGRLFIDGAAMRARLDGVELNLTSSEFSLLRVLAERAGRVLTRDQLLVLARGSSDDAFDRSIDVRISRLRQKLGDDPRNPQLLKTIRGAGYILVLDGEARA